MRTTIGCGSGSAIEGTAAGCVERFATADMAAYGSSFTLVRLMISHAQSIPIPTFKFDGDTFGHARVMGLFGANPRRRPGKLANH